MSFTEPGWYYAEGDPVGSVRYWDGESWVGDPTMPQAAAGGPAYAPGGRTYGSVLERLGARILDAIIVGIPVFIIVLAVASADDFSSGGIAAGSIIGLLAGAAYEIGFIALKGATPGKMILGLQVIGAESGESPPEPKAAALRWVPALVGLIPGLGPLISLVIAIASGVMINSDDQSRSVYDRIATTLVVKK